MDLKERMSNKLQELYSSLGFSKDVLISVAESAVIGLEDGCDDAALEARAKGFEGMLKSFQSNTERRVTDAVKRASEDKNKPSQPQTTTTTEDEPAWFKSYREAQEAEKKTLHDEIDALKSTKKTEDFDKVVKRVGKELGLTGAVLDLAKAGLSSDMDESAVKDALGKAKKTLMEAGAKIGSEERTTQMTSTQEAAERERAKSWVQAEAKRIQGNQ